MLIFFALLPKLLQWSGGTDDFLLSRTWRPRPFPVDISLKFLHILGTLAFTEAHKFSIYSINYTCIHLHKQKLKKNPCHYFNTRTISESNSSKMCISGIKVYLLFLADRTAHRRAPSAESEMDAERWETSLEKDKAPLYTLPIVSGWNEMCVAENKWKLQRVNQSIHHDKLHLCSVVKHDNLFQSQISVITFYLSAFTKIKSWCAILPMPPNQLRLIY